MKLTIIREDGAVYKDGFSYFGLDLSSVPQNVHALQWNEDKGWIEFVNESEFRRPPNEAITELPLWASEALDKWDAADYVARNTVQPVVEGAQTL